MCIRDRYPTEPTDVPADPTATTEPEATATSEPIATATNEPVTGEVTAYYLPTAGETIEEDGVVYELSLIHICMAMPWRGKG